MTVVSQPAKLLFCGIRISAQSEPEFQTAQQRFMCYLQDLDLHRYIESTHWRDDTGPVFDIKLRQAHEHDLTPDFDTTLLCQTLQLDTHESVADLDREIVLAMLASPIHFEFPSFDELLSALSVRRNIVQNARRTALAFDTEHAERPEDFWTYDVARGFTLRPGKSLIEALQKTTQPDRSGKLYSFSCYRATEYVILLSIAQELASCNPDLLMQLQQQWETRAIMSGQFHEVFLHEYGSMDEPLPPKYYVPGDRLWFRNPDEYSSNVEGYEGSWVFYLGDGLFTNFWKRDQPFTLHTKCVELFHWRNATYHNADGKLQIDDDVVDEWVAKSLQDPLEVACIVDQMLRLRDPGGIYLDGGCIDATRECARRLRAATGQLSLPG
ncbi:hypothetical protein EKL30_04990 [Candidimonas sp. SYP-B2681]|uniref:hypothetical protein n=1 Tax=Candidimonas sp. SYP-B2681 TaxID=2497686 RepID=UPI000F892536|nr:hypothetical protein [Candidimonas sp. SYP-B2681]RTZ45399.1 hypothetical protein EKL30_04990 [Candidimonas sp. SYP-B2681]